MLGPPGGDLDFFSFELPVLVRAGQHKGFSSGGASLVYAGNHIRVLEVVGFGQVGGRKMRAAIGMRMVKADNVFVAAAGQLDRGDQLFRVDAVTPLRRPADILARDGE